MSRTRMTMFVAMMAVLLLLAIASAGEAAHAAGEPGATAPSTLAPHYSEEADPNLGYLFAVYMVTWAAFFGYVFWISRRQRALGRRSGCQQPVPRDGCAVRSDERRGAARALRSQRRAGRR